MTDDEKVETVRSQDITWFRPLWRRFAVIGFLVVWLAWELLWTQDRFWGVLVGAILAYSLYRFFYAFPKDDAADGGEA